MKVGRQGYRVYHCASLTAQLYTYLSPVSTLRGSCELSVTLLGSRQFFGRLLCVARGRSTLWYDRSYQVKIFIALQRKKYVQIVRGFLQRLIFTQLPEYFVCTVTSPSQELYKPSPSRNPRHITTDPSFQTGPL